MANSVWRALFFLLPALAHADPALQTYLSATPLQLEVRYCECAVISPDSPDPLPAFMASASELNVAVNLEDKGFVSSQQLVLGYAIKPEPGTPDTFRFRFAGDYTTHHGHSTAQSTLLLEKGQWISLFGSQHGDTQTGVAVRLIDSKP